MDTSWNMVYRGSLIAILKHDTKGFERAVRPPGIRLLLENDKGEILLTREFRDETGVEDYRLPGGKVFDDLDSYLAVRGDDDALKSAAMKAAKLEAKQEAGVEEIEELELLSKSVAGASVEWDLYYFTGMIRGLGEQELEDDEKERGIAVGFYSQDEVLAMLKSGKIMEDRSANVLFKHILGAK